MLITNKLANSIAKLKKFRSKKIMIQPTFCVSQLNYILVLYTHFVGLKQSIGRSLWHEPNVPRIKVAENSTCGNSLFK